MKTRPIIFFDSGIGGLPYFAWLKEHLSSQSIYYIADRCYFPYGEKPIQELKDHIIKTVHRVIREFDPSMMVIACNTASVVALADLRMNFKIPFVGVVPAVKPAAQLTQTGIIGVLATKRTVDGPYLEQLIEKYASDKEVVRSAAGDIVDFVENRFFSASKEEREQSVRPAVERFHSSGADVIVLGCTHFIYLAPYIQKVSGRRIRVIDSREGVGKQALRVFTPLGLEKEEHPEFRFYMTGKTDKDKYQYFSHQFSLRFSGELS
ncbi:MAG: glutamate racemase [Spirochaetia bacterium]